MCGAGQLCVSAICTVRHVGRSGGSADSGSAARKLVKPSEPSASAAPHPSARNSADAPSARLPSAPSARCAARSGGALRCHAGTFSLP
eukprot:7343105-Prymnesium_polylepis.1